MHVKVASDDLYNISDLIISKHLMASLKYQECSCCCCSYAVHLHLSAAVGAMTLKNWINILILCLFGSVRGYLESILLKFKPPAQKTAKAFLNQVLYN